MGLAMVYGIVQQPRGRDRRHERGRSRDRPFEILLPPCGLGHCRGDASPQRPRRSGNGRVLVVDDEDGVREVAADLLGCLGYEVVTAPNGIAAVSQYRESGHEIDVVLLDLAMPGMDGRDCFRALKTINRDVKAVLCTGYGFNVVAQQLLDEGMLGIVSKPYTIEQLSDAIVQALHARR